MSGSYKAPRLIKVRILVIEIMRCSNVPWLFCKLIIRVWLFDRCGNHSCFQQSPLKSTGIKVIFWPQLIKSSYPIKRYSVSEHDEAWQELYLELDCEERGILQRHAPHNLFLSICGTLGHWLLDHECCAVSATSITDIYYWMTTSSAASCVQKACRQCACHFHPVNFLAVMMLVTNLYALHLPRKYSGMSISFCNLTWMRSLVSKGAWLLASCAKQLIELW